MGDIAVVVNGKITHCLELEIVVVAAKRSMWRYITVLTTTLLYWLQ